MKKYAKIVSIALVLVLGVCALVACANNKVTKANADLVNEKRESNENFSLEDAIKILGKPTLINEYIDGYRNIAWVKKPSKNDKETFKSSKDGYFANEDNINCDSDFILGRVECSQGETDKSKMRLWRVYFSYSTI